MMGRISLIALLVVVAATPGQQEPAPSRTLEQERLYSEVRALHAEAGRLYKQGKPAEAIAKYQRVPELLQRIYPPTTHPNGHLELATSLNNLGLLCQEAGDLESSRRHQEQAVAMFAALFPRATHPNGHPAVATSLNNLGLLQSKLGNFDAALANYGRALAMRQALFPKEKFPEGHADLATSLNNLAQLHHQAGNYEQALVAMEQALTMRRVLFARDRFPAGHPLLALTVANMAVLLTDAGQLDASLKYHEEALTMYQALYPDADYPAGHPDLATGYNNVGVLLDRAGRWEDARNAWEKSLAMNQKLYPKSKYPAGHPELAVCLNNLAALRQHLGEIDQARVHADAALLMRRALFPKERHPAGHLHLVLSLHGVGGLQQLAGDITGAARSYDEALKMHRMLLDRHLATATEAELLAFVQSRPPTLDAYLSLTASRPDQDAAAFEAIWRSRDGVSRVLEQRLANARAAGAGHADALDHLRSVRRRLDQLLQDTRLAPSERDRLLTQLSDERDQLERKLAAAIPVLKLWRQRDARGPVDLTRALPPGAAYLEFMEYLHWEVLDAKPGKDREKRTKRFVAFVVTPAKTQRVDLGESAPISAAIGNWRMALATGDERTAAAKVAKLVWDPLARQLPRDVRFLYLALDGDLARLPWAALPDGDEKIVLERCACALVPHGAALLEDLTQSRAYPNGDTVLALGDVAYAAKTWPALPGTRAEVEALRALAATPPMVVSQSAATIAKLTELLPKARYAHLATHGEFKADELAAEQKRARQAQEQWREGSGQSTIRFAAQNPLGFSGLVLANGEVMSGLSILDLNLENLRLVTLSACETGLGEQTSGKGIENLQRAFQLAGCRNVVASLWKVNDAATAALMAKFYHEMWVNTKPPIEALREAQLTIYRHPELIPDLAGERGAPRLKDAVAFKASGAASARRDRAATKLWAAFVFSGVGR